MLLAALLGSIGAHAADDKSPTAKHSGGIVADSQSDANRQGAFKTSGVNWTCKKLRCSASVTPSAAAAPVTACQELAREIGAIKSFRVANLALDTADLRQCNSGVSVAEAAAPTMKKRQVATKPATTPPSSSSASPHAKRTISADDFTSAAQPLPDAPYRVAVSPHTPSNSKSGSPPVVTKPTRKSDPAKPPADPAPASPPAGPFIPVALRTAQLTLTGIGVAEVSYRFTPIAVRTAPLTLTGTGGAEVTFRFTPVAVRTPTLTLTGTGRSE
ncbi:MAG: hypothetical protein K8S25_18045 [Alphaproteobacteria bacterium]|nr:hypothetical protein [Alphaproteobacteria bacterium]